MCVSRLEFVPLHNSRLETLFSPSSFTREREQQSQEINIKKPFVKGGREINGWGQILGHIFLLLFYFPLSDLHQPISQIPHGAFVTICFLQKCGTLFILYSDVLLCGICQSQGFRFYFFFGGIFCIGLAPRIILPTTLLLLYQKRHLVSHAIEKKRKKGEFFLPKSQKERETDCCSKSNK